MTTRAAEPWSFMVIADTQGPNHDRPINENMLAELVQEAIEQGVDIVLVGGDNVMGKCGVPLMKSELLKWRQAIQPLYDAGIGVYPIRGNHDAGGDVDGVAWRNVFSGEYALPTNGPVGEVAVTYSFTHKNAFFLGIDEYVNLRRVNQPWIDAQLADNKSPHVFFFGHEPAFSPSGYGPFLDRFPSNRNAFWASIENCPGGRVYFCGHNHVYSRARVDNKDDNPDNDCWQVIAGAGGAAEFFPHSSDPSAENFTGDTGSWAVTQEAYAEKLGYVLVRIDGLNVAVTFVQRKRNGPAAGQQYDATVSDTIVDIDSAGWNRLDITQILKGWLDNPATNHGLAVFAAGEGNTRVFHSQETDPDHAPKLTVQSSGRAVDIKVTADAFLYEPSPDANIDRRSDDSALQVKDRGQGDDRAILLQFKDLSDLAGLAASDIISAELELWVHEFNFDKSGGLAVHKVLPAGAYTSSTVTWNSWSGAFDYFPADSWSYSVAAQSR